MRILALETSTRWGSVAAMLEDQLLGEIALPTDRRTAQSLVPAIRELLGHVGWKPADIQLVAVTEGPGSFTGLRIGVTAAKTLAYAVNANLIGVNTLEVIAAQSPEATEICAVMDAQRKQLFVAAFRRSGGDSLLAMQPTRIVDVDQWLGMLRDQVTVTGPPLGKLRERLSSRIRVAPEEGWPPRASTVGRVAWRHFRAGKRPDIWGLVPRYYRSSAAEEKWQQRGGSDW